MLSELVQSLNKEELRFYKLYSQRYASGKDALGGRLLDLMRKDTDDQDDEAIFTKLYGTAGEKNTYYRLKNRLQEDLCDTLALLHFGKEETNDIHRLICVYNILYRKEKFELAYYFLRKAERKALQTENIELLDLIYTNVVKLSVEIITINPEEYVAKQTENALLINRMRQMDQVLAVLNYRIKLTQNFQKGNETLLKLVDKTVRDFSKDKTITDNRSFQIKIYRAISQAMLQKQQFKELEPFLLNTYSNFQNKGWFDKSTHDAHLQMLVYICNTLFKNRKLEESMQYAKVLGAEMDKHEGILYEKYLFFYYNTLLLVYLNTDYNRALSVLNEFEHITRKGSNTYYEQFLHLNKAVLYFLMKKYNDAVRSIIKLYVNDHYKQTDRTFKLKIEISEAIMQYESGDRDTTSRRIKQIKKSYKDLLKEETFSNDNSILDILLMMSMNDSKKLTLKLEEKITDIVKDLQEADQEAIYAINYLGWLAPKIGIMVNKNLLWK
jgi:Holliday junction resolvase RusA-like endonuclease